MAQRRVLGRWATPGIIRSRYRRHTARTLDARHPLTMTDKVYARMLLMDRARDDSITPLVDKLLVRRTVAALVGAEHLPPLLWSGADPHSIPFDALPSPAVLKPTHLTGHVRVLTEATDRTEIIRDAGGWLRENCYRASREYQYQNIEPRLMIEHCLRDDRRDGPIDYSLWCFHGTPELLQVRDARGSVRAFTDLELRPLDVYGPHTPLTAHLRPRSLPRMAELARVLSAPFEFVRVDFYDIDGHPLVGELTFTPARGRFRFSSDDWDRRLGFLWRFDPTTPVLPPTAPDSYRPHLLPPLPQDGLSAD